MGVKHKHAKVIKAWADGRDIEKLNKISNTWTIETLKVPGWSEAIEYRIKPEDIYRPYANKEEARSILGSVIKNKRAGHLWLVTGLSDVHVTLVGCYLTFSDLLKYYTFEDGTPLGIKN